MKRDETLGEIHKKIYGCGRPVVFGWSLDTKDWPPVPNFGQEANNKNKNDKNKNKTAV